jgi:two-component system CheB/CheR fusion protein
MKNRRVSSDTAGSALARPLRPLRIVVADDDRDAALTLMTILQDEGHEVRAVFSGSWVIAVMREFDPDVVILDIVMPQMSGYEIAKAVVDSRARRSRPLLVGISGQYRKHSDKLLADAVGFDHYLLKPCDPAALIELLAPLRLPRQAQ